MRTERFFNDLTLLDLRESNHAMNDDDDDDGRETNMRKEKHWSVCGSRSKRESSHG